MFNFKKTVATGSAALMLGLTLLHTNVSAFGGYTHYNICDRVVKNDFSELTEDEKTAYVSGATIADIGWFNWDKKYALESDGQKFAGKMIEIASKSEDLKEKYFALGWSDHVIQDEKGSVGKIFGETIKDYKTRCSILDAYITNNYDVDISAENLFIPKDLIRKTYAELVDFSPTDEELENEINSIIFAFTMGQMFLAQGELTKEQTAIAEAQLDELTKLCGINNLSYKTAFGLTKNLENN
ncbi:MAG: hypothetical protein LBP36_00740 [Oscillospiraceae bacterium]|nr:hypothetical protein [Oscillospiraceae bacterium]